MAPKGEKKGFLLLDNGRVGLDSLRRSMGVYLRIEITPNRVWIWASGNRFAFLFVGVVRNVLELAYAVEVTVGSIFSNSTAWSWLPETSCSWMM